MLQRLPGSPRRDGVELIKLCLFAFGLLVYYAVFVALLLALFWIWQGMRPAKAQEHHRFHHHYKSWVNADDKGCCDDRHCRPLADADERTSNGFLEVRIEGVWCPVLAHHYLKQGNVPDVSTSHVCAWGDSDQGWQDKGPCERLICYQPKPGS